ncbi:MAG: NADH-quinone oxidoreductase subunit F, partial [Verrucomicrobia bacterium]|nr:NADH-quinone oxidoreductase subunit F [Verrucomicrobiota bacterium]
MPEEYKLVLKHADEAGYTNSIKCYLKHGGYKTLKKAFRVKPKKANGSVVSPQEAIRKEVLASGLRGRG